MAFSGLKIAGVLLIAALVVGGAFLLWRGGVGAVPLAILKPVKGAAIDAVYATAVVEPRLWSKIAPLRTGRIVEVLFDEGVRIPSDAPLARMDDGDLRAQLAAAQSDIDFRRAEFERAEKLAATDATSRRKLDEARTALEQAQANGRMLEEQVRQMTIFSPINGVILWRGVEPGEVKQSGQTIFWIGEPKPLRLEAEVDEQDIPRIRRGQKVLITADAFPGQVLSGEVESVTPKGDPVSKSYRVFVSLPDETPLMIGMTVETNTIVAYKPDALLVPASAVRDGAVWVASSHGDGNAAVRKASVAIGVRGEKVIEVVEGIGSDDFVIASPPESLAEGDLVSVETIDWPAAEGRIDSMASYVEGALSATPFSSAGAPKCGQIGAAPQIESDDDKYTRLRKEWQSRGTCFPDTAPPPKVQEPAAGEIAP